MLLRFVRATFEDGLNDPTTAAAIPIRNTSATITHLQRESLMLKAYSFGNFNFVMLDDIINRPTFI
jgi:hypothetical protein